MSGETQAGAAPAGALDDAPLKLRAQDAEDLRALAVCLQDALVPLAEVAYLQSEKRFVMVANRFRWERGAQEAAGNAPGDAPGDAAGDAAGDVSGGVARDETSDARFEETEAGPRYQRVHCAICFDRVRNVQFRNLDPRRKDQILSLLTLEAEPGAIQLLFSGGGAIRLEVSDIRCHLEDLGEPWPTRWRPSHAEAG